MGDAVADQSQGHVQAQSSTVHHQRPITIARLQIGRAGSSLATDLAGHCADPKHATQARTNTRTALELL